jgi:hypothetical protein
VLLAAVHESGTGTKLPFAAVKTTSAFWGTAVEKCSLWDFRSLTHNGPWPEGQAHRSGAAPVGAWGASSAAIQNDSGPSIGLAGHSVAG